MLFHAYPGWLFANFWASNVQIMCPTGDAPVYPEKEEGLEENKIRNELTHEMKTSVGPKRPMAWKGKEKPWEGAFQGHGRAVFSKFNPKKLIK